MNPDFADAAERHWEDSELLLAEKRLANADHLLGLSAECSLKAVMLGLGMPINSKGAPRESYHRTHIDTLWHEFQTFVGDRGGARYASYLSASVCSFEDWDIGQRYARRNVFSRKRLDQHRHDARLAKSCMQAAILDGVIP